MLCECESTVYDAYSLINYQIAVNSRLIASFSHICVAMACCAIFLGVLLILLTYFIRKKDPKPIFGVYTRPGKWYYLKYVVFACLYYFRKVSVLPVRYAVGARTLPLYYIYATI